MITRSQVNENIEKEFNLDALLADRRVTVKEYLTTLFTFQWHSKANKVSQAFSSSLKDLIDDQSDKQIIAFLFVKPSMHSMVKKKQSLW